GSRVWAAAFANSASSVAASAATGTSSERPHQTEASGSQRAWIVKITGFMSPSLAGGDDGPFCPLGNQLERLRIAGEGQDVDRGAGLDRRRVGRPDGEAVGARQQRQHRAVLLGEGRHFAPAVG